MNKVRTERAVALREPILLALAERDPIEWSLADLALREADGDGPAVLDALKLLEGEGLARDHCSFTESGRERWSWGLTYEGRLYVRAITEGAENDGGEDN